MAAKAGMGKNRGYLATAVGTLVGGVGGAFVGFWLGVVYVETFMADAGLEALLPVFFITGVGVAVGIGIGVWGALRLRKQRTPGVTGNVSAFLGTGVGLFVLWAVEIGLDDVTGRGASEWLAPACAAVAIVLTTVGVRIAITRFRGSDWDEPSATN